MYSVLNTTLHYTTLHYTTLHYTTLVLRGVIPAELLRARYGGKAFSIYVFSGYLKYLI